MQPDTLLAHHDRADVGFGRALDDRVDRITDQEVDPFALQDMGDGVGDFHRGLLGGWPAGLAASLRHREPQRIAARATRVTAVSPHPPAPSSRSTSPASRGGY